MKILLSNDDGIHARGLRVLARHLAQDPDNAVYVVAPDRERSATGHALTLHKPLRVEEFHIDADVKGAWFTTGTPSDCVKFAVGALLDKPPSVIISGINSGPNLGSEILYSGTVSAAMEGAILGLPSIAVSLVGRSGKHFEVAADFIADLVKILPTSGLPSRTLLNVNVPNLPADQIKGVAVTELGVRLYNDYYEKRMDPRGKVYYWLCGQAIEEGEAETTDVRAVSHGYISVTPVTFNMTDQPGLVRLREWGELAAVSGQWAHGAGKRASLPASDGSLPGQAAAGEEVDYRQAGQETL